MSKPQRVIHERQQSGPAKCERVLDGFHMVCGAPMQLVIKEPKCWSYQERISERCAMGHIAHAQAVVSEPESWPVDEGPQDCWGAF